MDPWSMDPLFGPGPWTPFIDWVHGPGPWTPYFFIYFFFIFHFLFSFFLLFFYFFYKKINHTKPNHNDWVHGHPIFPSFKISCKEIVVFCWRREAGGCNSGTKCLCFAGQNVFVDDWYDKGDRPSRLLRS